ncbi:hypothetical protein C2W64_04569 [Brevibacillus laterosporus]|nr:hypothetical protein [Brevibacillus laterosporus]RAP17748.1 hypothetical protein C2W64_04569 [Brevibacillus laterosporus]
MKVVQRKLFLNRKETEINEWLSKIPVEDIVSVSFQAVGFEEGSDEYTSVFYKTEI